LTQLSIPPSGLLTSWAIPAVRMPSEAIFSLRWVWALVCSSSSWDFFSRSQNSTKVSLTLSNSSLISDGSRYCSGGSSGKLSIACDNRRIRWTMSDSNIRKSAAVTIRMLVMPMNISE